MQYKRLIGTVLLALLLIAPYVNWFLNQPLQARQPGPEAGRSDPVGLLRPHVKRTGYGFIVLDPPSYTVARSLAEAYKPFLPGSVVLFRELPEQVEKALLAGKCCVGWGGDPRLVVLYVNAYYKAVYGRLPGPASSLVVAVYPNNSVSVVPLGVEGAGGVEELVAYLDEWYSARAGVLVLVNPQHARYSGGEYLVLGNDTQWGTLRGNGRVLVLLLTGNPWSVDLRVYQALLGVPVSRSEASRIIGSLRIGGSVILFDVGTPVIKALRMES